MFLRKIFCFSTNNFSIFLFIIFLQIILIKPFVIVKRVFSYQEEQLNLDKNEPIKYFLFQNFKKEINSDIILQIKKKSNIDNNSVYSYIYGTNIYYNNVMNLIKINESTNEFINYLFKFDLNSKNYNIDEYPLTYYDEHDNNHTIFSYYYIVFQLKSSKSEFFKANILLFNTLDIIEIAPDNLNRIFYYKYENNYEVKNYIFKINCKEVQNNFINVQILSYDENNKFNISLEKLTNDTIQEMIYSSSNINKLDYTNEIKDTKLLIVNLTYIKADNLEKQSFAILFEFSLINYIYPQLNETSINIKLLSRNEYYFYYILDGKNEKYNFIKNIHFCLEFLSTEDISIENNYFSLEYLISEQNDFFNQMDVEIKNKFLAELIKENQNNFNDMKSNLDELNSIFFFKADINITENLNKILILKIVLNDNNEKNKLIMKNIKVRFLPLIKLTEKIYNEQKSYIKYYNLKNFLDNFGYYYVPIQSIQKTKILYCPFENAMNIYLGEFDLAEKLLIPNLKNQKIYLLNPYNHTLYNGITIITNNSNSNYFFQFGDIEENILNNLEINIIRKVNNLNREIKLRNDIKELYFFNINYINESFILDGNLVYGNVSVEFLSLDSLNETEKNFNNIFPLNKQLLKNNIKIIKNPTLINSSNYEIIRIMNNQYEFENNTINKYCYNLLYINRYKKLSEIEKNQVTPLFISSENKISRFKIITGDNNEYLKYKFFVHKGNYDPEYQYNISIFLNNKEINVLSNDSIRIYNGSTYILKFNNQIRIINNGHQDVLIWTIFGDYNESDYEMFNASSKSFNNIMNSGKTYLFIFDYFNIINKKNIGLDPYKFIFTLERPISVKSDGYYLQFLSKKKIPIKNLLFELSSINSIYFEIRNQEEILDLNNNITFSHNNSFINALKDYNLNTLINQINGYLTINFYMIYKYDITNKINELLYNDFDDSIYSINYQIAKPNKKKYLLFQVLFCTYDKDLNISFYKENSNISYSMNNNNDKGKIEKLSKGNYFGYADLNQVKNEEEDNYFINVIKPGKLFIRYLFSKTKIDFNIINLIEEQAKYHSNINIEKSKKIESKTIFSVSFDCLLKNTLTNYYILILEESEEDIINECQFLSQLYKYEKNEVFENNLKENLEYQKYFSFTDEGINDRIKREITFDNYGNYKIYILAEEIENLSLFKLLGVKTYSYVYEENDISIKDNIKNDDVSFVLILIIIILSVLILIIISLIIYRICKKDNFNQMIAFMKLSKNDSNNSINNALLNKSALSIDSKKCRELEDKLPYKDNINNHFDNNIQNNEEDKLDLPPPPVTAFPDPDNQISEMVNQIKSKKMESKIYNNDKIYTNDGSNTDVG